jgi:uncharacterized protein YbjT (DUF2867 family)
MNTNNKTVLVTGATGQQGGATARQLLADGWRVRALVRRADASSARRLAQAGAELVVGDLTDRATLDAAVKDVYGVFSVQYAEQSADFIPTEVLMGVNIADAAQAADVEHLVYTSVGGADRNPTIPSWISKARIEEHLATLDVPTTILRPVMFMENHASPGYGIASKIPLIRMIPPQARVQLIAVRDVGSFAALAFADPGYYVGKAIELAGDELTGAQLVAAFSTAIGRPLEAELLSAEVLATFGLRGDTLDGPRYGGWQADIPALRALHPGLLTLDDWLSVDGKAKFAQLLAAS